MLKEEETHCVNNIEYKVIYSGRRTLGISVLPDSSVIIRVPYFTSKKTIRRIVQQKSDWIIKHRDNYTGRDQKKINRSYINGETHLFRGKEYILKIEKSGRPYIRFLDGAIEIGLENWEDPQAVKKLLYKGYKNEAQKILPEMLHLLLCRFENQQFKPTGLIIRSMKRRWGSCSNKGIITLSTELIKLDNYYAEYVIVHELCHLKHHNHGPGYYKLLSELFPEWKSVRKEMKKFIV